MRVREGDCRSSFKSVEITHEKQLAIEIVRENFHYLCNDPFSLKAKSNKEVTSYQWMREDTMISTGKNCLADRGGTYHLTVTTVNGCTAKDKEDIYAHLDINQIKGDESASEICAGDSVLLTGTVREHPLKSEIQSHTWLDEKGNIVSTKESCMVYVPGKYTFRAKHQYGCTRSKTLQIYDCNDPNKIVKPKKVFSPFPISIDSDLEQAYYKNFAERDSFITNTKLTIEQFKASKRSKKSDIKYLEWTISHDSIISSLIGSAYALEHNVNVLNQAEIFASIQNKRGIKSSELNQILEYTALNYYRDPNETMESYIPLMNPKASQASMLLFEGQDKLALVTIASGFGFKFSFATVKDQVVGTYLEPSKVKYFIEEPFDTENAIPVDVQHFSLNSTEFKHGQPIYGYCELDVHPYYVDIDKEAILHLKRHFKFYFKVSPMKLGKK